MDNNLNFRGCKAEILRRNKIMVVLGLIGLILCAVSVPLIFSPAVGSGLRFLFLAIIVIVPIPAIYGTFTGAKALMSPKRCASFKYIAQQTDPCVEWTTWHETDNALYEIDKDIEQSGVRHGKIILSDNWIWIDGNAKMLLHEHWTGRGALALKRENLKRLQMRICANRSHGREGFSYMNLILELVDNNENILRLVDYSGRQKWIAKDFYQSLCELFPDIPNRIEIPPLATIPRKHLSFIEKLY